MSIQRCWYALLKSLSWKRDSLGLFEGWYRRVCRCLEEISGEVEIGVIRVTAIDQGSGGGGGKLRSKTTGGSLIAARQSFRQCWRVPSTGRECSIMGHEAIVEGASFQRGRGDGGLGMYASQKMLKFLRMLVVLKLDTGLESKVHYSSIFPYS